MESLDDLLGDLTYPNPYNADDGEGYDDSFEEVIHYALEQVAHEMNFYQALAKRAENRDVESFFLAHAKGNTAWRSEQIT